MKNNGGRLEEDFVPTDATQERIRKRYPELDIDIEIDKFTGYWTENTTQRAIKANWQLAFINWCHNAVKFLGNAKKSESTVERRNKIVDSVIRHPVDNPFDAIAGERRRD